ncbi:MAG: hypothetical protein M3O64_02840 [Chloroflexota bacterium]|nr:hypothetical protein [Chloroflexota bacterium]
MIDRTEHDERTESKKSRETVDDDPNEHDGEGSHIRTELNEEAGTGV